MASSTLPLLSEAAKWEHKGLGGEEEEEVEEKEGFLLTFDEHVDAFRRVVCSLGMDLPPVEKLSARYELWGVSDERSAEIHLTSFALASLLPLKERVACLTLEDTAERIRLATQGLRNRCRRMSAELAVRSALGSGSSSLDFDSDDSEGVEPL